MTDEYWKLVEPIWDKVSIYDASWHEYGNREDTPVESGAATAAPTPEPAAK